MSTSPTFDVPGAQDDDVALRFEGKLTTELDAALGAGLTDMQLVPSPSELKGLADEAPTHPSVTLDSEAVAALMSGITHPHEVLDQLVHPDTVAEQLRSRRSRNSKAPLPTVSPIARLQRLATDTCYATAVRSPLHQLPGLKVLVVNPRFLAKLQHAFTSGHVTDPALEGSTPGLLEIHLPTSADLRRMIVDTVQHHLLDYDWSDSIARTGVQEALVAMTMRVHYADGSSETIVVVIDGQSRLVSAWRTILGLKPGEKIPRNKARETAEQIVGRMFAHDAVSASRKAVNTALQTAETHGWSASEIQLLHSHLAPVNLVTGTFSRSGQPCDTTQWFTEFLTQIHLRTRSWGGGSDREKAVADALATAARVGKLTKEQAAALSGRLHSKDFTNATGLPFHPAYARGALIEAVLSAEAGPVIRTAIAEYLSLDPTDSQFPRNLLEVVATFATRFLRSGEKNLFPGVVHAWTDGGSVTREMWDRVSAGEAAITLTRLTPAQLDLPPQEAATAAVNELRKRAEEEPAACAELALLGGDALIVAEALSRDRGSKENLRTDTPQERYTPYRAKPNTIVAALSATTAGRLMLGEALADWVKRVPGEPEDFSRLFTVPAVNTGIDGAPEIITSYGAPVRALEWNVFETAFHGLPSSRRKKIEVRREAARASTYNDDEPTPTLDQLQTKIHGVALTLTRILESASPPNFETKAEREALQQLLWKLGGSVGNIPIVPPPVPANVYEYPSEGNK
ncbi:hypothetical protein [Saccharopolyspora sp. NPDC049426]|uniref:hypothetical protein n=1 Tax=Saccharopolyspora sp. NPDC049426 TaxID=3155652 RepID=UPI0034306EEA